MRLLQHQWCFMNGVSGNKMLAHTEPTFFLMFLIFLEFPECKKVRKNTAPKKAINPTVFEKEKNNTVQRKHEKKVPVSVIWIWCLIFSMFDFFTQHFLFLKHTIEFIVIPLRIRLTIKRITWNTEGFIRFFS